MRTLLRLAYDGAPFCGWQIQPKERTVQGDLDDALSTLSRQPIQTMGAGRTDTGVHAKEMFVHFDWAPELGKGIQDLDQLVHRLNRFLDPAIRIYEAREVQPNWHARFDATSRSYSYHMVQHKNPFAHEWAYTFTSTLDFEAMNAAAALLLTHTNFKCFSRSKTDVKTYDCNVTEAIWKQVDSSWVFYISSNRFLRNMVRAIVGTLLDVGTGKTTLEDFQNILNSQDRTKAGSSAPAHGLFLTEVHYPNTIFDPNG